VLRVWRLAEEIYMMQGSLSGAKPRGSIIKGWFGSCGVHCSIGIGM
jgi:hypothetical protein